MRINPKPTHPTSYFLVIIFLTMISCSKSDDSEDMTEAPSIDLTKLPFGGNAPTDILIRNQGDPQPDFLSLWLCGLPTNGAGANNAGDWTNPDGTWDYTKKPQVEGNITWDHEFEVSLDGNGNRIITGNNLPNHPTGIFPIQQGTEAWEYDKNPNIISEQMVDYTLPAMPQVAPEPSCFWSRWIFADGSSHLSRCFNTRNRCSST